MPAGNKGDEQRIGITASFTVDPLISHLKKALTVSGEQPTIVNAPFNQIHQSCFAPQAAFGTQTLSTIVVLWRLEDLFPDLLTDVLHDGDAAYSKLRDAIDDLVSALRSLRENFSGTIVVSSPANPSLPFFDLRDIRNSEVGGSLYRKIINDWERRLTSIDRIISFDVNSLLLHSGFANSHDARKWYLYKLPYTDDFCKLLSQQLARVLNAQIISSKKCVVLDCDNTLWGGIVGEDGLSGIAIGQDFPGSVFQDFQKYLLQLKKNGIFLTVASKNNLEDVLEVFDTHDAMILSKKDISVFEVHWNSKAESIKNIAKSLNIGTDSIVFIDDNPKEISEVSTFLPEVTCLLIPEEEAEIPGFLQGNGLFDSPGITSEDKNRVSMMAAEKEREVISETLSKEDFLGTLDLKVDVFSVTDSHVARVSQLINKTNQFNLTTVRRSQDEVESLIRDEHISVLAMNVSDRFGDYGLAGVAIIDHSNNAVNFVETLLMSCRVLGRGVESAFLSCLAEIVKDRGGNSLSGRYSPSRKNRLVEFLYRDHGFSYNESESIWHASIDDITPKPTYVTTTIRSEH